MRHQVRDSLRESAGECRTHRSTIGWGWRKFLLVPLALILTGAILSESHALLVAVQSDNVPEVQRLLSAGADVNSTDEMGFSLLVNALAEQDLPVVDILMQHGAEVFHNAKRCKSYVDEDADTLDAHLLRAITEQNVTAVKALLRQGAEVNACDDVGFSMLVNALAATDNEMINFLVASGATMKTSI